VIEPGTLLALLLFAIVLTRPYEERLWRAGRVSDRASALLILARLPVLAMAFGLITGRPWPEAVALTAGALLLACALYPFLLRRIRRGGSRSQPGG